MISNITSNNASSALNYAMQKGGADMLTVHGMYGETAEQLAAEMRAISDTRNIKNPVMHISLSLDGNERGSDDQWRIAADTVLKNMGFDLSKSQYVLVRHNDAKHDHVHIIANRVQLDNSLVSDSHTYKRGMEATRAAEIAAGLTVLTKDHQPSQKGKIYDLKKTIDNALFQHKNYEQFKNKLNENGINIIENRSKTTGYLSGLSYELAESGQVWKGSNLGKAYSLAGLEKQGLQTGREALVSQNQANNSLKNKSVNSQTNTKKMQIHSSASQTQSRVDAEKAKADGNTSKAKASAQSDENKRLQVIKHEQSKANEEEYE